MESFDIDLSSECIEEGFKIAVDAFSRFNKILHVNCLKNVTDRNQFVERFKQQQDI